MSRFPTRTGPRTARSSRRFRRPQDVAQGHHGDQHSAWTWNSWRRERDRTRASVDWTDWHEKACYRDEQRFRRKHRAKTKRRQGWRAGR